MPGSTESQAQGGRYSYSSTRMGVTARVNEFIQLVKMSRRPPIETVEVTLKTIGNTRQRVEELTGVKLEGLKALDIGPGQLLRHMRCLSVKNDIVGIDLDVIPQSFNLKDYLLMLRHNSVIRTAKTMARRALGRDAAFAQALAQSLGVSGFRNLDILRMSATAMTFPAETFDFVCSYSVFEHIDDPKAALAEVRRVLKPGGVAYISVHIYTSHSGAHDPTMMSAGSVHPPFWPHLRPETEHLVQPSTYLNKVSLAKWKEIFQDVMPGVKFVNERQDDEIGDGLKDLRAQGALSQYDDEELMTVNFIGVWQKPKTAS